MTRKAVEELKRQVKARLRRGSTPAAELRKVGAQPRAKKKRSPAKRKRRT